MTFCWGGGNLIRGSWVHLSVDVVGCASQSFCPFVLKCSEPCRIWQQFGFLSTVTSFHVNVVVVAHQRFRAAT